MQPRVPSHPMRRSRRVAFGLAMAMLVFALPAASFAQTPVVDSLSVVPSIYSAAVSANVASDGGSPITERGFIYSVTAQNADPMFGGSFYSYFSVSGTLGAMSGTISSLSPNQNYSVKGYAYNGVEVGYSAVQTFTTPCPAFFLPPVPSGSLGTSYLAYVYATGTFEWNVYGLTGGSLPPGLTLDPSGYIWGTPTTPGIFNFTVTVVDQYYGCAASRGYSVAIEALEVHPRKIIFASELVNVASPPRTVTVTNNGPSDVNLLPFTISAPFTLTVSSTPCGAVLTSGNFCTM